MSNTPLMKDGLNKAAIKRIAMALHKLFPEFDYLLFEKNANRNLNKLELKQRVTHIMEALHYHLPQDFIHTVDILGNLPTVWEHGDPNDPLAGFAAWPIIDYVGAYGLLYPDKALPVLKTLTPLFSAEFAIRDYLIQHTSKTQKYLHSWVVDENHHVRRLVSEGTRPRLPWGKRLPEFIKDPAPVIELLEILKNDSSEYVRRSVANNLNDISKDHPDRVITVCKHWQKSASKETNWIIKHGTRSLVKAGHPEVFPLLGYTKNPKLTVSRFKIEKKTINLGENLEFRFNLSSNDNIAQNVVIDYAIHYLKSNGETRPKVFKLKTLKFKPHEMHSINKTQSFKAVTTRKHYAGEHILELLINGKPLASKKFVLNLL